jgi:adenylate kinase
MPGIISHYELLFVEYKILATSHAVFIDSLGYGGSLPSTTLKTIDKNIIILLNNITLLTP